MSPGFTTLTPPYLLALFSRVPVRRSLFICFSLQPTHYGRWRQLATVLGQVLAKPGRTLSDLGESLTPGG